METETELKLYLITIVVLSATMGFCIAGAYNVHNLNDNQDKYIHMLDKVVQTCKVSYHQRLGVFEDRNKVVIILKENNETK